MNQNKLLFHRDVILTTAFTFFIIFLLGFIFFNSKFLNPIGAALKDFQFTDIYFSAYKAKNKLVSNDIILINIADHKRAEIVEKLIIIESFSPKVLALDITFPDLKNEYTDTLFKEFIQNTTVPIVSVAQIEYLSNGKTNYFQSDDFFELKEKEGFGNFLAKEYQTVRYISAEYEGADCFAAKVLKEADFEKYQYLKKRNKKTEVINYSGKKFVTFNLSDINNQNQDLNILTNKIVMLGYLGMEDGTMTLTDAHLTPLNKSFGGKSIPDMYGIEIHAEILTMFLEKTYISEIPKFVSTWIIGFFIALLHMYLFLFFFVKQHIWFHIVAKGFQLISFGVLFFLALGIYHLFHIKLEPSLMLLAVVLSVDAVYFFEAIMIWIYKKFGVNTYYNHHH